MSAATPEGATHVFSVGLIPVQDFIEQAKRSRDLKAGSALLSAWMHRILGTLHDGGLSAKVKLPRIEATPGKPSRSRPLSADLGDDYSLPNRASGTLRLEGLDETQAAAQIRRLFGGLEEEQVLAPWRQLREQAARHLIRRLRRHPSPSEQNTPPLAEELEESYRRYTEELDALAGGHGDGPVHLLWCVLPLADLEDGLPPLDAVDRAFQAVKIQRPIAPWHGGPAGKCNQCGAREAFGPQLSFAAWHRWQEKLREALEASPELQRRTQLDPGERLCWVCYARRRAGYSNPQHGAAARPFPSTGDIAVGPWLMRIEQVEGAFEVVEEIRSSALGKEDFGRSLLASETQLRRLEALPESGAAQVRALRRRLEGRLHAAGGQVPLRPTPYLALLSFDGDGMGEHAHRDPEGVPKKIRDFNQQAARLLERDGDALAAPFYLGGDEGLAMVPAAHALDLARALREAFRDVFEEDITLSAGLAFFEYSRPLRGALRAAHAALGRAKARPGKDALAVAVETASGKAYGARVVSWTEAPALLGRLAAWMAGGRLSTGWVEDAAGFLDRHRAALPPTPRVLPGERREAALEEIRRLFHRRWQSSLRGEARYRQAEEAWRSLAGGAGWGRAALPDPGLLRLTSFLARHGEPAPARPGFETPKRPR